MPSTGKAGLLLILIAFPVYLMWRNRLSAYTALASGGTSATTTPNGQVNTATVQQQMGVPVTAAAPGTGMPADQQVPVPGL